MVNASESTLNLVKENMQKMLRCMDQNGEWAGLWSRFFQSRDNVPPGESRDLNFHFMSLTAEHGKPVFPPIRARRTARAVDGYAGKGFWRKRMPLCNGADRS